jgi:drug/metabolite transporter (DMT)-like permease
MNVAQERETPAAPREVVSSPRGLVAMVACSTLICAAAQILMKIGTTHITHLDPIALITNGPLVAGYGLYGVFCLMMVLALRQGELSVIYPIISLAYIWVTVCSYFIFHDTLNLLKLIGVLSVILGVAMLGRRKEE